MTVTRKDVARLAGTSPAVVSYVLNGGPRGVAEGTKARVLHAVDQLGYRPNRLAASLRSSRTMSLGLVVPDNANPFFAELARAVEDAAFSAGYTMLLGNATDDEDRQSSYVRTFIDRRVDGILLIPSHDGVPACLADLTRSGTPWVVLDRRIHRSSAAAQVLVDNRGGARAATEHLLEHGRRRIACVAGPEDVSVAADRVAGWRDALSAAGLPDAGLVQRATFGWGAGYEAARELLDTPTPTDAFFVASDEQAIGVLRAVSEAGLRCPDDVAIVSFDGIDAGAYTTPPLTTMRQPLDEIAAEALSRLVAPLDDGGDPPRPAVLPVSLIRRGSCGC